MTIVISEKVFEGQVKQLAGLFGYLYYHTWRSFHSPSGFPDVVMMRLEPGPRMVFAELKTDDLKNSQPSFEQWLWLYMLQQLPVPVECYLWRPSDLDTIAEVLR